MAYYMAVHIGSSRTTMALVDAGLADIIGQKRIMSSELASGRERPGELLGHELARLLQEKRIAKDEVAGIGVGIPGTLSTNRRMVGACPNLPSLDGQPLAHDLESTLGMAVVLENNANLEALGEHRAGCGQDVDNMAMISVGSGLGAGLIIHGALYRGAAGVAGEFGHTNIIPDGRLCSCGAHGCLEMYCSGQGLEVDALDILTEEQLASPAGPARSLIEQAMAGNVEAEAVLVDAFELLGVGIAGLVNLLNPELVVLQGSIALAWRRGIDIVRTVVEEQSLIDARTHVEIRLSELAPYAGILGAAALVDAEIASSI